MALRGEQFEVFVTGLVEAYPTLNDLTRMVQYRLGTNLAAVSTANGIEQVAFDLVTHFEARGETDALLVAARHSRPKNPALLTAAQMLGLAPDAPSGRDLERIVKKLNGFVDLHVWRERLGEIEGQVCRVEVATPAGKAFGTGFLVGPDVVMTNHHVVESALERQADGTYSAKRDGGGRIRLRFDYKRGAGGATVSEGTVFELDPDDWLVDATPPSPVDFESDPKSGPPDPDHLDCALLRLATRAGAAPLGSGSEPGAPRRGWIEIPEQAREVPVGAPILIVQHPSGHPIKLAFDSQGVLARNGTRLRYGTNTMPGSSGSPCFDVDWNLVALHHSGDHQLVPQYNEGILLAAIRERLERRGLLGDLTG